MNVLARVGESRAIWKRKACERASQNRYLRRQLAVTQARVDELRRRVRALEAAAIETPRIVQSPELPSVELADAAHVRTISVLLVVQAIVSFRSVPRILELTRPGSWIPHFTSVILWTLRVGLYLLGSVAPSAEPWIAVIDTSIDVGLSKLLVVVRVPLGALARRGAAITLSDCQTIGLKIRSTWDGESVAAVLKESFIKAGNPVAILKDGGTDLARGVELWRDEAGQRSVRVIEDIGHIAANALKREFGATKAFRDFLDYVRAAARKLWQSDVACFAPSGLRTKGRFQSITRLARWAKRLLPLLGGKGRVGEQTVASRLRQLAGGLSSHRAFLERFMLTCEVVERCLKILKNHGMNQSSYRQVSTELERLPERSHVRKRLERWARRQLTIQCRLGIGQLPLLVSSDVIESLFGKLKVILARNPKAEFNRIVLTVPTLCGALDESLVHIALRSVTHRNLEHWEQQHVPPTQCQARLAFNRGQIAADAVLKTAQGP